MSDPGLVFAVEAMSAFFVLVVVTAFIETGVKWWQRREYDRNGMRMATRRNRR